MTGSIKHRVFDLLHYGQIKLPRQEKAFALRSFPIQKAVLRAREGLAG